MTDSILLVEGERAGHPDETVSRKVLPTSQSRVGTWRLLKRRSNIKVPSSQSISLTAVITGLLFVGLNIGDAWLSKRLLAIGYQEANPMVSAYGANMVIKGFLALAIVVGLVLSGKAKLLWILNICMLAAALWNTGWLLHSS